LLVGVVILASLSHVIASLRDADDGSIKVRDVGLSHIIVGNNSLLVKNHHYHLKCRAGSEKEILEANFLKVRLRLEMVNQYTGDCHLVVGFCRQTGFPCC
jgi:hypothetical protein